MADERLPHGMGVRHDGFSFFYRSKRRFAEHVCRFPRSSLGKRSGHKAKVLATNVDCEKNVSLATFECAFLYHHCVRCGYSSTCHILHSS